MFNLASFTKQKQPLSRDSSPVVARAKSATPASRTKMLGSYRRRISKFVREVSS
jgi:hypothetical protein